MDNFNIRNSKGVVIIEKGSERIEISPMLVGDLRFASGQGGAVIELQNSFDVLESYTYSFFEELMKSIIGKYFFNGDYKNKESRLPEDFVNAKTKTIIFHCENGTNNTMKLEYNGQAIRISIGNDKGNRPNDRSVVCVKTKDSAYGYYHEEFWRFYRHLNNFSRHSSSTKAREQSKVLVKAAKK